MNPKFAALVETLAPKLEQLIAMVPLGYVALHAAHRSRSAFVRRPLKLFMFLALGNFECARGRSYCCEGFVNYTAVVTVNYAFWCRSSVPDLKPRGEERDWHAHIAD